MILKQHLEIDDLSFDIAIRKPPPADKNDGYRLDAWMTLLVKALEERAGRPFDWGLAPIDLEESASDH